MTGGGALALLALVNALPGRIKAVLAVREWLNPWGNWGLFVFGLLVVIIGLLPIAYRLRARVIPSGFRGEEAQLTIVNRGDARTLFANGEILIASSQFRRGDYQLPWTENDGRELMIPQEGIGHLLIARVDSSKQYTDGDGFADIVFWQSSWENARAERQPWTSIRQNMRDEDGTMAKVSARAILRVTLGSNDAGRTYRFKPLTKFFVVEGSLYGGCSVRDATAEEIRDVPVVLRRRLK